jgi:hypothetical protein
VWMLVVGAVCEFPKKVLSIRPTGCCLRWQGSDGHGGTCTGLADEVSSGSGRVR